MYSNVSTFIDTTSLQWQLMLCVTPVSRERITSCGSDTRFGERRVNCTEKASFAAVVGHSYSHCSRGCGTVPHLRQTGSTEESMIMWYVERLQQWPLQSWANKTRKRCHRIWVKLYEHAVLAYLEFVSCWSATTSTTAATTTITTATFGSV